MRKVCACQHICGHQHGKRIGLTRRLPLRSLHAYPVTFWAAPFAVPMIDVALQFAHGDAASFARHFKPLAFLARIDTINYLRICYRPLFRFTRLIWRADASSAPKIAQQRSVATRIRETCSAVLPLNSSRLHGLLESNRELQIMM